MVNVILYVPKTNSNFSGYISTVQGNISNNIDINSAPIWAVEHDSLYAFEWSVKKPYASKEINGWLSFSFKQKPFYITHYELGQRTDSIYSLLKKWVLEGSNNNETWKVIDRRSSVPGFEANGERRLFEIRKKGKYIYYRLRNINEGILTVDKIEVYGFFCEEGMICNEQYSFLRTNRCPVRRTLGFYFVLLILRNCY